MASSTADCTTYQLMANNSNHYYLNRSLDWAWLYMYARCKDPQAAQAVIISAG